MSGTAQVNTDKDGIFGRFLNIYDGTNFRRLLGNASGHLLSGLRPATGYIPQQISDIVYPNFVSPVRGAANYDDDFYTVPANKILVLTDYFVRQFSGTVTLTILEVLIPAAKLFDAIANLGAVVYYPKQTLIYVDEGDTLHIFATVTAAGSQYAIYTFGYLINKT